MSRLVAGRANVNIFQSMSVLIKSFIFRCRNPCGTGDGYGNTSSSYVSMSLCGDRVISKNERKDIDEQGRANDNTEADRLNFRVELVALSVPEVNVDKEYSDSCDAIEWS